MSEDEVQAEMLQMQVVRAAPKICKDCAHYRLNGSQPAGSQHRCNRPILNLVTGQSTPHDATCESERGYSGECRHAGVFWEPRT